MPKMVMEYNSSSVVKRYRDGEPILSARDVGAHAQCTFNAGVTRYQGKYVMAFRSDYGYQGKDVFEHYEMRIAFSDDGIHWKVRREPFLTTEMFRYADATQVYDPRLVVIDERCYVTFSLNTLYGVHGGVGVTDDFVHVDILSLSLPDNRNFALFPELIDGQFVRLERPFPLYSRGTERFDIWLSRSDDLRYWGRSQPLLTAGKVAFSNNKIGPAAPPLKTEQGWLTTFHAVTVVPNTGNFGWNPSWRKCYCAGIMLLDLDDPSKIIGMCKTPLLAPETVWETDMGYRSNVIFPGGMLLDDDGIVRIYYGASDTFECLATAQVDELIGLCIRGTDP